MVKARRPSTAPKVTVMVRWPYSRMQWVQWRHTRVHCPPLFLVATANPKECDLFLLSFLHTPALPALLARAFACARHACVTLCTRVFGADASGLHTPTYSVTCRCAQLRVGAAADTSFRVSEGNRNEEVGRNVDDMKRSTQTGMVQR